MTAMQTEQVRLEYVREVKYNPLVRNTEDDYREIASDFQAANPLARDCIAAAR